ncbi:MAG TPA: DMT family transporter [Pseudolabrys sp.]|nr:DMT family transporter [Pseudolabrys sp.]
MTARNLLRVVLWMTGALLSFSTMAVSVRELWRVLNIFEILTVRSSLGLIMMLALLALRSDLRPLIRPQRMGLYTLRNTVHFGAQYCWATALTLLPFATVFALEFTTPAWTALLATWLLGERLTVSRIGVIVLGLIGVLIILRPGLTAFNPGAVLVLIAAFGFAIVMTTTKMLTKTEPTFAIIFWMMVIQLPLGLAGSSPTFPLKLGAWDLLPVLGLGISGMTSHFCLSNAFRAGDATVVVPLDFLRVPLIAVVGWAFYRESLDIFVFAGAAVILCGLIWNLRTEARRPH